MLAIRTEYLAEIVFKLFSSLVLFTLVLVSVMIILVAIDNRFNKIKEQVKRVKRKGMKNITISFMSLLGIIANTIIIIALFFGAVGGYLFVIEPFVETIIEIWKL